MEEDYIKDLTTVKVKVDNNEKRLDKCEERLDKCEEGQKALFDINNNISRLCLGLEYTNKKLDENTEDVKEMKGDINILKAEPSKKKAAIVDKVVAIAGTAIVGGVLGFILAQIAPTIFK